MKILLLSDTVMNCNGGGLSQTLYNLFSFSQPQNILCVSLDSEIKNVTLTEPYTNRYIGYHFDIIPITRNRYSKYINPLITRFNFSYNYNFRNFKKTKQQIAAFKPDVVISCSNGPVGVFMHAKLVEGLNAKVFPYFMDDWMYGTKLKWIGGEIHQSVKAMLRASESWLMISTELAEILTQRYDVKPKSLLVVHNPVDLSDAPEVELVNNKNAYTLAYAGALWPMHYDSFYLIAKSVNLLKNKRDIKLIVYTSESFWNWRKDELEPLGVLYGGSIPYKEIHQTICKADALILASSFLEKYYSHSKGSVQTKITDYLKSKRLIISCGPNYSANHNFLKKYNCGVCIESDDVSEVAAKLDNILNNIVEYQNLVLNGWEVLEKEFTFSNVHKKLVKFISNT